MKRFLILGCVLAACAGVVRADVNSEFGQSGRYQMFANPHANRVYVLDTQTGRVFQLVTYKGVSKELLEEVPYVYGSARLCSPSEYEHSNDKCFARNYDYIKELMNVSSPVSAPPPPAASEKTPDSKP